VDAGKSGGIPAVSAGAAEPLSKMRWGSGNVIHGVKSALLISVDCTHL